MSFFDSEFVRSEMVEISELQEDIYGNVFKFPTMSKDCLLYTSPSPRDVEEYRMPSSA